MTSTHGGEPPAATPTYNTGDRIVVTARGTWDGQPIHGKHGAITRIGGVDAPNGLYSVNLDEFDAHNPVPLHEDEIAPAGTP